MPNANVLVPGPVEVPGTGLVLARANYDTFAAGKGLAGSAKTTAQTLDVSRPESLPRHIVCRWIIRVE